MPLNSEEITGKRAGQNGGSGGDLTFSLHRSLLLVTLPWSPCPAFKPEWRAATAPLTPIPATIIAGPDSQVEFSGHALRVLPFPAATQLGNVSVQIV
jgi:hypothetical protein